MKFTDYLIVAISLVIGLFITEVIMPGAFHKILMGLAGILFVKFWFEN